MPKSFFGVNAPKLAYFEPSTGYLVDAAKAAERIPGMVWGELPFKRGLKVKHDGAGKVSVTAGGTLVPPDSIATTGGMFKVGTTGDVRNLSLRLAGQPDGETFTAEGKEAFAPAGIVRLMDWTRTNGESKERPNAVVRWADRCKPEDQLWSTPKGAPYEPWLDYAVRTGTDLWLNVPHMADDEYVRELAELCKARIGPATVNLYLEDSNEVWNYQFGQTVWQAAKPGGKEKWHAERTLTIGRIFRQVFGAADKRVRPVLGCGLDHPWHRDECLKHIGAHASELYGLAIAPYFGDWGVNHDWTPQQFADHLLRAAKVFGTDASNTTKGVRQYKAVCDRLGLKLLAYEGGADIGQLPGHLKPDSMRAEREDWERRVAASQLLPQVGEAIEIYLEWWRREGGAEFCYYNSVSLWNRSGVWGLESLPGQRGPKWQAWARVANRHPRPDDQPQTPTPTPVPDVVAVPAPQGLRLVTNDGDRLEWEWRGVTGTTGYRIYLTDPSGSVRRKVEESGNAHHFTEALPGTYTVTAVRGAVESPHSAGVTWAPAPDPADEAKAKRIAELKALILLNTEQRATLNDALAALHKQLAGKQREAEEAAAELAMLEGR